ncbi:MFS transporter [Enemella sp. A6]|uniref:MFS transporter n=1 Tax=Enemella sp. A6 TaxID=3440152 RepID=UPI003EB7EA22
MGGGELRPRRVWALYFGGFMGPFGAAMVNTMLPELATGLGVSLSTATWAITSYMIPFSLGLLVSGTLAARYGQSRTVRLAFLLYAVSSVACVLTTDPTLFFLARGLQGLANAFTTPVLIAMIARTVPSERLGRAMGLYTSVAAAGQAFAPLVGGLAAGWDYRAAFAVTALVGLALALLVPSMPMGPRVSGGQWRALANLRLLQSALFALGFQGAVSGVMVLGAMIASDRFGLSPGLRGLVVASFGVAGLIAGPAIGSLADRIGIPRTGFLGALGLGVAFIATGWVPWMWGLVALVFITGLAGTAARIGSNAIALRSTPVNPGGATSVTMSAQFVGTALAPVVLLPLYVITPWVATLVGGGLALFSAVVIAVAPPRFNRR